VRLAALALLLALPAAARAENGWEPATVPSPGRVSQLLVEDLTGDGRPEILLVSGRRLIVHDGRAPAGEPVTSFLFDPTALVFCAGSVDADPSTREIVFLRRGGAAFYAVEDGKLSPTPRTLLDAPDGIVTFGQADDVHWRRIVADLDGNGADDVVLPTRAGYRLLLRAAGSGDPRTVEIPYPLRASIAVGRGDLLERVRYVEGVPDWASGDFDGDGVLDFALLPAGRLHVHRGGKDGFSPEAAFSLDLSRLRGALGLVRPTIHDVNRDGIPDLMANEPYHGRTTIFLGRRITERGLVALPPPAVTRRVSGWSWEPRLEDVDGDGWDDLVLPTTEKVGPLEAAAVLVSGRLGVRSFVFRNTRHPDAPFREEADAIREIQVDIRLSLDMAGRVQIGHTKIVDTGADFTGDGRRDLLLQTKADEIAVFPGSPEGVPGEEPWRRIAIPSTADDRAVHPWIGDLDADGVPDVLLRYESWSRDRDRVVLLLSRKE
jgi:hypothetical protein